MPSAIKCKAIQDESHSKLWKIHHFLNKQYNFIIENMKEYYCVKIKVQVLVFDQF